MRVTYLLRLQCIVTSHLDPFDLVSLPVPKSSVQLVLWKWGKSGVTQLKKRSAPLMLGEGCSECLLWLTFPPLSVIYSCAQVNFDY